MMEYIHMQNQVISGMLRDMDKLTSMITNIHHEQEYIKRVFMKPTPPPMRPVSVPNKPSPRARPVQRPVSVPHRLPNIAPRPPTSGTKGRGAPRKLTTRPVLIF